MAGFVQNWVKTTQNFLECTFLVGENFRSKHYPSDVSKCAHICQDSKVQTKFRDLNIKLYENFFFEYTLKNKGSLSALKYCWFN